MRPYHFWYVYFGDGSSGLLLDFVKFPDRAYTRAAVFTPRGHRVVESVPVPLSELRVASWDGALPIRLGDSSLDCYRVVGATGPVRYDLSLAIGGPSVSFTPRAAAVLADVPRVTSRLDVRFTGTVSVDGQVLRYENVRGAYAYYWIRDLTRVPWRIVSALNGDRFALEFAIARALGGWHATGYLRFDGDEFRFEGFRGSRRVSIEERGDPDADGRTYAFTATRGSRRFRVEAHASSDRFVTLHRGPDVLIHTTLLGSCMVTVSRRDRSGDWRHEASAVARDNCLLETKD